MKIIDELGNFDHAVVEHLMQSRSSPVLRPILKEVENLELFRAKCRIVGLDPEPVISAAEERARTSTLSLWEALDIEVTERLAASLGVIL